MEGVSIFSAVVAGFLSFVSPCVLPLIPAYVSYISGESIEELRGGEHSSRKVLINSIAFVIGFSIVFVLLGASATLIGNLLIRNMRIFKIIAGIVMIVFGLHISGVIRINLLNYEKRLKTQKKNTSFVGALLLGFAFSFGWTPCVGPILGAILLQASTAETLGKGILLLSLYSAGLGIPFVLTAVAINVFFSAFSRIKKYFRAIEIVAGVFLVVMGILLIMNKGIYIGI